jgi:hypothetical protein
MTQEVSSELDVTYLALKTEEGTEEHGHAPEFGRSKKTNYPKILHKQTEH